MRRDVPGGVGDDGAAREAPDGERRRRVTDGPEGDGDASGVAVAASGHDRGDAWGGASRGGEERPRGAAHREGDVSGEQHGTRSDAGGVGGHGFYFISSAAAMPTRAPRQTSTELQTTGKRR